MRHVKSKALSSGLIKRKGSLAPNAVLLDPTDPGSSDFLAAPLHPPKQKNITKSDHFQGSPGHPTGGGDGAALVGRLKASQPHFSMPLNKWWS